MFKLEEGATSAKAVYLDASALIKLVIDEDGSEPLIELFNSFPGFHSTSMCMMEALGRIKGMHFNNSKRSKHYISLEKYNAAIKNLVVQGMCRIEIYDINLFNADSFSKVLELAYDYELDISDALQLATLRYGKHHHMSRNSRSILVSADKNLAKAAKKEGFRVWDCLRESEPSSSGDHGKKTPPSWIYL